MEITHKLAEELSLPVEVVDKTYKAYWLFIKTRIEAIPLKEDLTEEEFNRYQTNFNLPYLGKLNCTYKRWLGVKKRRKFLDEEKYAKH